MHWDPRPGPPPTDKLRMLVPLPRRFFFICVFYRFLPHVQELSDIPTRTCFPCMCFSTWGFRRRTGCACSFLSREVSFSFYFLSIFTSRSRAV
ncbi:hypothetical protein C8R44DRAFT_48861 [Mycena epipterygia]|nr:hypothetical protein C8R44DRAFT_48861 [Mycena epipterygia]